MVRRLLGWFIVAAFVGTHLPCLTNAQTVAVPETPVGVHPLPAQSSASNQVAISDTSRSNLRQEQEGRLLQATGSRELRTGNSTTPVVPQPTAADSLNFEKARDDFFAKARMAYLDRTGQIAFPSLDPLTAFGAGFDREIRQIRALIAQAVYVRGGRGSEDMPVYADMVVLVASRLGIEPPETTLPIYRDRTRQKDQALTKQEREGLLQLTEDLRRPDFVRRYLFVNAPVPDTVAKEIPAAIQDEPSYKSRRHRSRRRHKAPPVVAPPEPKGPSTSILSLIDWDRAEALATAAEKGAAGWNRRTRRRRQGRCYEWVRLALQRTGLWTDEFRDEVTMRGDRRRPRRAYSFAWAMNLLEGRGSSDPFADRKVPLRRLDLRVDPLVKGSIVVFDRNVCGYNAKSGHIEVISSIEPLRASSYKFHVVKLECLVKASTAGKVHIYVPWRLDPRPVTAPIAKEPPPPSAIKEEAIDFSDLIQSAGLDHDPVRKMIPALPASWERPDQQPQIILVSDAR